MKWPTQDMSLTLTPGGQGVQDITGQSEDNRPETDTAQLLGGDGSKEDDKDGAQDESALIATAMKIIHQKNKPRLFILGGLLIAYTICMGVAWETKDDRILNQYKYKYLYAVTPINRDFSCPYEVVSDTDKTEILTGIELDKCKQGCYGSKHGVGNEKMNDLVKMVLQNNALRPIALHVLENRAHDWDSSRKQVQTSGVCHCINDYYTMHAMHDVIPFNQSNPSTPRSSAYMSIMQHAYTAAVANTADAKRLLYIIHLLKHFEQWDAMRNVQITASSTSNNLDPAEWDEVEDPSSQLWFATKKSDAVAIQTMMKDLIGQVNPSHWTSFMLTDVKGLSQDFTTDSKDFKDAIVPFCARVGIPATETNAEGIVNSFAFLATAVGLFILYLTITLIQEHSMKPKYLWPYQLCLFVIVVVVVIHCALLISDFGNWQKPMDNAFKKNTEKKGSWNDVVVIVTIVLSLWVGIYHSLTFGSKEYIRHVFDCIAEDLCLIFGSVYLCLYALSIQFFGNVVLMYLLTITVATSGIIYHIHRQFELLIIKDKKHQNGLLDFVSSDVKKAMVLLTLWVSYIFLWLPGMDENPVILDSKIRAFGFLCLAFVVIDFYIIDLYYGTSKNADARMDKTYLRWYMVAVLTIILQVFMFQPTLFE